MAEDGTELTIVGLQRRHGDELWARDAVSGDVEAQEVAAGRVERAEAADEVAGGGSVQPALGHESRAHETSWRVHAAEDLPEEVLVTEHLAGGHGVLRWRRGNLGRHATGLSLPVAGAIRKYKYFYNGDRLF